MPSLDLPGEQFVADVRQAVRSIAMRASSRLALVALLAVTAAASTARAQGLRRFAIVAGNDTGGGDTRPLLYASADARKVYDILTRLGGVRPEDATLLIGASASQLPERARRGRDAGGRGEASTASARRCFFYYSGHAKDGALRLGETRLPIDGAQGAHRRRRRSTCASRSSTRASRARSRAPRGRARRPRSRSSRTSPRDAKGLVILTSSTSDEDSQESDAIGGSYFSHHLASGLLGGADRSGDGRVTLFEAYAYAYDRTVADTAESAAGAQHPTFSYDLAGNGDLVLTDVAVRHEGVYLPREAPGGVYYLVDGKGFVAAEISKADGVDRRVALAPGRYRVKRRLPDRLRVGEIDVPRGQLVALDEARLRDAPFSDDPVKGAGRVDLTSRWSLGAGATYQSVFAAPSGASLFPPTGMLARRLGAAQLPPPRLGAGARPRGGVGQRRRRHRRRAVQVQRGVAGVVADRRVAAPLRDALRGRAPRAAAHGPHLHRRRLSRRSSSRRCRPGSSAAPRSASCDHTSLVARGRLHYLLYNVDEDRSLGYWELAAMVSYDL